MKDNKKEDGFTHSPPLKISSSSWARPGRIRMAIP